MIDARLQLPTRELVDAVETELKRVFDGLPNTSFYDLMRYHLGWKDLALKDCCAPTGKRLRPLLCLLACEASGGDYRCALVAAAAIELLHNFTLIHDDIEDGDILRHGRPTVWAAWGIAQALNVGDGMHVLARSALTQGLADRVAARTVVQLSAEFDQTCLRICQGQHLDIAYQDWADAAFDDYFTMVRGKSAALLSFAAYAGAVLGGAAPRTQSLYRRYGELLGIGFQIRDDVLGIWGDEAVTGKSSRDFIKGKKTLPIVYALSTAARADRNALLKALSGEDLAENQRIVLSVLEDTGARAWVEQEAQRYRDLALEALEGTGIDNPAQQSLRVLTAFSTDRSS